jgi:Arm domain-containing DNA-binding protein
MALTVKQVEHAKPSDRIGDGDGLWLFVAASGAKSWMFRFTSPVTRKAREMGLGPAADVRLAEARDAAQQARKLVLAGMVFPNSTSPALSALTPRRCVNTTGMSWT